MELKASLIGFFLAAVLTTPLIGEDQSSDNPGIHRPVSSQEIDQLKRQIYEDTQSNVELIVDYHTETGDLNNRLDFWRYGARANFKWRPNAQLYFSGVHTPYTTRDNVLNEWGTNFTVGLQGKLSEHVSSQLEVGGTRFSTDTTTVNALGSIDFKPSEKSNFHITASRSNVEESLLSVAGIRPQNGPFAGTLVGRVMDNRVVFGGYSKLPARFDLFGEGGLGIREGSHIESNFFQQASGGLGYNLIATSQDEPLSLFRASYSVNYFGFNKNLFGFGGASLLSEGGMPIPLSDLGSDGISPSSSFVEPGVGGYFSPRRFLSNIFRVDLQGRPNRNVEYRLAGFVGSQDYTGSSIRRASGLSGSLIFRLSDRFSVPVTYLVDNFGPFTQQTLFARLVVRF